jgi:hypothetical protein
MLDSGKSLAYYFKNRRIIKNRFSDFVILSHIPILFSNQNKKLASPSSPSSSQLQNQYTLDCDSDQLLDMSYNTIKMLENNRSKKVYPYPIIPTTIESVDPSLTQIFQQSSMGQCSQSILTEKQYTITFNFVGHGTPEGIGFLDPEHQYSPINFARLMDELFKTHGLAQIASRHLAFEFHTCNSAYANVNSSLTREDILDKVRKESFIGIFYDEMKNLGYEDISVTGYRGFYCTIDTSNSDKAVVQDSFTFPTFWLDAEKARYTIYKDMCTIAKKVHDIHLSFSVTLDD